MLIGVILPDEHPWRSQADSQGVVSFDGQVPELTKASRTPLDLLLIDLALLDSACLPELRRYRVARPRTRIVVSFSHDTRPGNQILASCVGLGVYDILNRDTPLSDALAVVRCYADVAQWHSSPEETTAAARKWPLWRNRKTGREKKIRNEKDESAKQAQSTRLAGAVKSKRSNGETAKDGTATPFFPVPTDFASLDEDTGAAFYPSIRELCEAKPSAVLVSCGRKDLTETIKTLRRESALATVPLVVVGDCNSAECYNAGANDCIGILNQGKILRIRAMASRMKDMWDKVQRDDLTGLYKRNFLNNYLTDQERRFRETGVPFSIIMADLDYFKKVNDSRGHQAGDAVLKQFAAFLQAGVRQTDVVARYGGEEFLLVFPGIGVGDAWIVADKLRRSWAKKKIGLGSHESISCTFSAGAAEFGLNALDLDSIISAADKALYCAKESGRNQVIKARKEPVSEMITTNTSSKQSKRSFLPFSGLARKITGKAPAYVIALGANTTTPDSSIFALSLYGQHSEVNCISVNVASFDSGGLHPELIEAIKKGGHVYLLFSEEIDVNEVARLSSLAGRVAKKNFSVVECMFVNAGGDPRPIL